MIYFDQDNKKFVKTKFLEFYYNLEMVQVLLNLSKMLNEIGTIPSFIQIKKFNYFESWKELLKVKFEMSYKWTNLKKSPCKSKTVKRVLKTFSEALYKVFYELYRIGVYIRSCIGNWTFARYFIRLNTLQMHNKSYIQQ